MSRLLLLLLVALTPLVSGCGLVFGVDVKTAKTMAKPPANVMVYISVEENGEPVADLDKSNFKIYENDVLLDKKDISLRLVSQDTVADGHTVLLLDLSGDINKTDLKRISRASVQFVEKVSVSQAVTVMVYDGSKGARLVARFPKVEKPEKREIPDLAPFVSGDASSNLNGAVIDAIKALDDELKRSKKPVQLGTLATIVHGPDLAGRSTDDELTDAIRATDYEFYTLSPEKPPKQQRVKTLGTLGKDSRFKYDTMDTLPMAAQDLGMRVRDAWGRHYLVTWCTPARNGERDVRIAIEYFNDSGNEKRGKGRTSFNAAGFDSGCGPMRSIVKIREEEARLEAEAQARAEAKAAEELREAEEAAAARRRAQKAQQRAAAANAAAEATLAAEEDDAAEEETEDDEVIAPPSDGKYE